MQATEPKVFEYPFGKKGNCVVCRSKKSTLVCEVCLECSSPERQNKRVMGKK